MNRELSKVGNKSNNLTIRTFILITFTEFNITSACLRTEKAYHSKYFFFLGNSPIDFISCRDKFLHRIHCNFFIVVLSRFHLWCISVVPYRKFIISDTFPLLPPVQLSFTSLIYKDSTHDENYVIPSVRSVRSFHQIVCICACIHAVCRVKSHVYPCISKEILSEDV